uniref:Uncharacterized protein n=1 Tax=Picea glauca TaxID=3330 RepID=A0A101M2L6_PICGL|nr:hypothetical protein ABT39_MTgene3136 [Picea glauca]QHR86444.1 hypothetical protein Q903MT_gene443 [Picea sitchensis]
MQYAWGNQPNKIDVLREKVDHCLFEDHGGSTVCRVGQWAANLVGSNQLFGKFQRYRNSRRTAYSG